MTDIALVLIFTLAGGGGAALICWSERIHPWKLPPREDADITDSLRRRRGVGDE